MNRLGMLADLSHVSKKTMLDVLNTTRSPVIFSHSSAFTLCNSTRNVQDDVLSMMVSEKHKSDGKSDVKIIMIFQPANGGVVMVAFVPSFITCNASNFGTVSDVAGKMNFFEKSSCLIIHSRCLAHINHIRKVAGIDHVGIGADYDGVSECVFF
jgi:membrane dipeptidase